MDKKKIKQNCDEINKLCIPLDYVRHRGVQELLCEILKEVGYEEFKGEIMSEEMKCIAELFLLIDEVTKGAVKRDLSLLRSAGAGGCDMYQGMPPICRRRDDILDRYENIITAAVAESMRNNCRETRCRK